LRTSARPGENAAGALLADLGAMKDPGSGAARVLTESSLVKSGADIGRVAAVLMYLGCNAYLLYCYRTARPGSAVAGGHLTSAAKTE
jgi:hypothetical protein